MTNSSPKAAADRPPTLTSTEIDELLSMTIIANLATLDDDGGIHIVPMWFLRLGNAICIPTSRHTHKYKNLCSRPRASVMIDISRAGLDLKGVLISGRVELVEGEEAQKINHAIHFKYVTPEGLSELAEVVLRQMIATKNRNVQIVLQIQFPHQETVLVLLPKINKVTSVSF